MRTALACLSLIFVAVPPVFAQDGQAAAIAHFCQMRNPHQCADAVAKHLEAHCDYYAGNAAAAFALIDRWYEIYRREFLKVQNQPRAKTDIDYILEEVKSVLDPIDWCKDKAKDKAMDAVENWLRKNFPIYASKLAFVRAFLESPSVKAVKMAIKTALTPSTVLSDLDELERSNQDVYKQLSRCVLSPSLRADWIEQMTNRLENIKMPDQSPVIVPGPR